MSLAEYILPVKKIFLTIAVLLTCIACFIQHACHPTALPDHDSKYQNFLRWIHYTYLKLKCDPFCGSHIPMSTIPIDVIIPVIEKDIETLLITLESVRGNILQPIKNIYLIAPESDKLRNFAKDKNCIFVFEDTVLPIFSRNTQRKGWVKQQYLKLNADMVGTCEHFLIIDADTILIRPQVFVIPGKEVLNILHDYWPSRKQMVKTALGFKKLHNVDFTSHHMLISKQKLKVLKQHLQNVHKKPWQDALDTLTIPEGSFSEYELYGNFVAQHFDKEVELVLGANALFPRDGLNSISWAREYLSCKYKSMTMHSFLTIEGMTG